MSKQNHAPAAGTLIPIGPSSTDYDEWVSSRPDFQARFQDYHGFTQRTGYEIWRNAWLACEREHGIRTDEDAPAPQSESVAGCEFPTAAAG